MVRKLLLALSLMLVPGAAKACPPAMFNGFASQFAFNPCFPNLSIAAFDVPSIQFVPQVQFVPQLSFQRQFFLQQQQQFQFPVSLPQSIQPFAANIGGYGGAGSFGNFNGLNFGNSFGNFRGFNGFSNSFRGDRFEFDTNGRRTNIRESPRGGVRIRSR